MLRGHRPLRHVLQGYAWMTLAIVIWASWLVFTSSGRITTLSVVDLAVFRSLIPAIILAPLIWRHRAEVAQLGFKRCLLLSAYGAPFILCVGYGLGFAPVAHAGAMVPGLMPVVATILGVVLARRRMSQREIIASICISLGAATILLQTSAANADAKLWFGHLLFLAGSICWACFSITVEHSAIRPFLATAIVATISAIALTPVWLFAGLSRLSEAELSDIAFQAVFQGIGSGVVSLFAYSKALQLIGHRAVAFSALTPGVAALLAIPVLSQIPRGFEILALALVMMGLRIHSKQKPEASTSSNIQSRQGQA